MSKPNEADVRAEVRAWLDGQLGPQRVLGGVAQQTRRLRLGHAAMAEAWYGRGLPLGLCARWKRNS